MHYSEVGSTATHIVKSRGDDIVRELTSVCDSLPFSCNMSDVKDKGKVNCLAELVVIDTNNPEMNIPQTVNNPSAYRRRFIYVEPIVKQEHRIEGSNTLNPESKSEDYYDKWTFRVITKKPIDLTKSQDVLHLSGKGDCGIDAFERVFRELVSERISAGERDLRERKSNYFVVESEAGLEDYVPVGCIDFASRCGAFASTTFMTFLTLMFSISTLFTTILNAGVYCFLMYYRSYNYRFRVTLMFAMLLLFHFLKILLPVILLVSYVACSIDYVTLSKRMLRRRFNRERL